MPINKVFELNYNSYFSKISNFTCKLRFIYPYFNNSNASWLLVVISIDRFVSISHPRKFLLKKKPWFQHIISFSIIIFHIFFYIPTWFNYYLKEQTKVTNETIKNNKTNRSYKCVTVGIWIELMGLMQQIIIPFIIMALFTILAWMTVFKSRLKAATTRSNKDIKFTIASITINIQFLILNLPYFLIGVIYEYTNVFDNEKNLFYFLNALTYFLVYSNMGSTFLINYFVNSIFKIEVKTILKKL